MGDPDGKWLQSSEFSRKLQMPGHSDIATVVGNVLSSVPGQTISGRNWWLQSQVTQLLSICCLTENTGFPAVVPRGQCWAGLRVKVTLGWRGTFSYIHGDFPALWDGVPVTMTDGWHWDFALWISLFTPWSVLVLQTQKSSSRSDLLTGLCVFMTLLGVNF